MSPENRWTFLLPLPITPASPIMTRKSIEAAAKGLIAVIFVIFLVSVYKVMGMMGLF